MVCSLRQHFRNRYRYIEGSSTDAERSRSLSNVLSPHIFPHRHCRRRHFFLTATCTTQNEKGAIDTPVDALLRVQVRYCITMPNASTDGNK